MLTLKVGDIIQNSDSKHKILEVGTSGNTVLISRYDDFEAAWIWYTIKEIEKRNFHLAEESREEWPKMGDLYYYLDVEGIYDNTWDGCIIDSERKNFLGIYPTRELAKEALNKCQKVLGIK